MSVNTVTVAPTSLAFGTVLMPHSKTLSLLFTNVSGPSCTITPTLNPSSAYTCDTTPFTLAGIGDNLSLNIVFTPDVVGNFPDFITFDCSPLPNITVPMTGRGFSNVYPLPQIANNPAGTMKISLIVDPSLPELTIPSTNRVLNISPKKEYIDRQQGVMTIENVELVMAENYTTYASGFWYYLLNNFPILITPSLPIAADLNGNEGGAGASNWAGNGNHSVTQDATHVHSGSEAFKLHSTGAGDFTTNYIGLPAANNTVFNAANRFTVSMWVYPIQDNTTLGIQNAGVESDTFYPAKNLWNFIVFSGVAKAGYGLNIHLGGSGDVWFDDIQVSQEINEPQIEMILNEAGTDTYYFWGKVYLQECTFDEPYISGSTFVRSAKISLVDIVQTLKDGYTQSVLREIKSHVVDTYYVTLQNVLASIASVGFSQTFTTNAVQFRSHDVYLIDGSGATLAPESAYFIIRNNTSDAGIYGQRGYIDGNQDASVNPCYWASLYGNPYDLLVALSNTFGWTVRHYFGQPDGTYAGDGSDIHILEFLNRGNSFTSSYITAEKGIVGSSVQINAFQTTQNIRVSDVHSTNDTWQSIISSINVTMTDRSLGAAWAINGHEFGYGSFSVAHSTDFLPIYEPPRYAQIDIDSDTLVNFPAYQQDLANYGNEYYRGVYHSLGGSSYEKCLNVVVYDYQAKAFTPQYQHYGTALSAYYNRRFSKYRKTIKRVYGSLKFTDSVAATTTHQNLKPMRITQINDGLATLNYYATEVIKDFMNNRSAVTWAQQ